MILTTGFKTDVGRKRENNEDSYAVLRREQLGGKLDGLFVVADGMGGAQNGDVASGLVAQAFPDLVREYLLERNGRGAPPDTEEMLRNALSRANHMVWTRAIEDARLKSMGTTCVAAVVKDGMLTIGNVGDSRAYLLRDGRLSQITEDHSEVWEQVKAGNMTREQASRSKHRNVITQAIGRTSSLSPDVFRKEMEEGDTVLLCTDGLTTEVMDTEIARILATAPDAQAACDRLVSAALRNGGSDNITVVALRFGAFTPLDLPETLAPLDDETPTDPSQDWRQAAMARVAREDDEPDSEWDDSIPSAAPVYRDEEEQAARGGGGFLQTLAILLVLLALAEGAALYIATKNRVVRSLPSYAGQPETKKPTDAELLYDVAIPVIPQDLRPAPLLIDSSDNLYVVTKLGAIYRISRGEKGELVSTLLKARDTRQQVEAYLTNRAAAQTAPPFVFDASSYRYQIARYGGSAARKPYFVIEKHKFSPQGATRVMQFGEGELKQPTSLAVDSEGSVYVIDAGHLVKFTAIPPEVNATSQTMPAPPRNTERSR